jgi:hypothetical protein
VDLLEGDLVVLGLDEQGMLPPGQVGRARGRRRLSTIGKDHPLISLHKIFLVFTFWARNNDGKAIFQDLVISAAIRTRGKLKFCEGKRQGFGFCSDLRNDGR